MKFTWTIPVECEINIQRCAHRINEKIQETYDWLGKYPDEDTIIDYTTDVVLDAVDGEGYMKDEVPNAILIKMCGEVLKYVGYQTIMDLGEE